MSWLKGRQTERTVSSSSLLFTPSQAGDAVQPVLCSQMVPGLVLISLDGERHCVICRHGNRKDEAELQPSWKDNALGDSATL